MSFSFTVDFAMRCVVDLVLRLESEFHGWRSVGLAAQVTVGCHGSLPAPRRILLTLDVKCVHSLGSPRENCQKATACCRQLLTLRGVILHIWSHWLSFTRLVCLCVFESSGDFKAKCLIQLFCFIYILFYLHLICVRGKTCWQEVDTFLRLE